MSEKLKKDYINNSINNNSQRIDVSNNNQNNVSQNLNSSSNNISSNYILSQKSAGRYNRNKVKNYNSMLNKPNVKLYLHSPFILLTLRLILIIFMNYFLYTKDLVLASYFYRANFFICLLFYISDYSNEKYLKLTYVYKNIIGNVTDLSLIFFHTTHEQNSTNLYILLFLTVYFLRFILDVFYYGLIVCDCSYLSKNTNQCIYTNINFTRRCHESNQNIHFLSTCVLNASYIEEELYIDFPILLFLAKNQIIKEIIRIICQFYFYEKNFFHLNLPYWFIKISIERYLKVFFYFISLFEAIRCVLLFKTLNSSRTCITK